MALSKCLGNTKRTGVYIFNKSVSKCPNENVPKKWGQNLKKLPSQTKSARVKPKDLVTLESGHLSLFRYPTRGNGTYLGRGEPGIMAAMSCSSTTSLSTRTRCQGPCPPRHPQILPLQIPEIWSDPWFPPGFRCSAQSPQNRHCLL